MPSITIVVRSKLSAVVTTKHAKVASKALDIKCDAKPSFCARGTQINAYRTVKIVHESISIILDLLLQDAYMKTHKVQ